MGSPGELGRRQLRLFFFDSGVLNGLLGNFAVSFDRIGSLFEHLVVSQLWAAAAAHDLETQVYTFRTRGGLEVDFVVRVRDQLWAVEAKAGDQVPQRAAATLLAVEGYLPKNAQLVVVVPAGPPRRLSSGVDILSLPDLLTRMMER
ncbi:MAG: DUF4143 domain-containing protein [Polyangia bacterium]